MKGGHINEILHRSTFDATGSQACKEMTRHIYQEENHSSPSARAGANVGTLLEISSITR